MTEFTRGGPPPGPVSDEEWQRRLDSLRDAAHVKLGERLTESSVERLRVLRAQLEQDGASDE